MLITGMFLCSISYGASISDLLGGKKSIKLSCKVEEAVKTRDAGVGIVVGSLISYEISKNKLYVNNEEWSDEKNIPTINKNSISFFKKVESSKNKWWLGNIEINRISGSFQHDVAEKWGQGDENGYIKVYSGVCEKVADKKF